MNPRFKKLQRIGNLLVVAYHGHTAVNPRNGRIMHDIQHWYRVRCNCNTYEFRSQQELRDVRRIRACADCRQAIHKKWSKAA